MRVSLFITCTTHHSLTQVRRISEEGNTGTRHKKKTTAVESASYCFGVLHLVVILSLGFNFSIGAHSISEEVVGFCPLWFP